MSSSASDISALPLGRHLAVTSKFYYGVLTKMLEHTGLDKYFTLLLMVDNCREKCTQQYLAKLGHIDKAQVTHMIDDCIRRGYLIKEQNPEDRREYLIRLSPKSVHILPDIRNAVADLEDLAMEGISKEEQEIFKKVLCRAYNNLSQIPAEPISFQFKPQKKNRK
jgi:MarR family transcriptional regulator, transcriptional regulator for hemolysin